MKKLKFNLSAMMILCAVALSGCKTTQVQDTAADRDVAQAARSLVMLIAEQKGVAVKEVESAMIKDLSQSLAKRSNGYLELFGTRQATASDLYRVDQAKLARVLGKDFSQSLKMSEKEMASIQTEMMQSQASSVRQSPQMKESASQLSKMLQGGSSKVSIEDQGLRDLVKDAKAKLDPNHAREIEVLAENLSNTAKTLESSEAKELINSGSDVIKSELRIFEKSGGNIKVIAEGCGNSSDIVALKNFSKIMKETEAAITRSTVSDEVGPIVSRSIASTLDTTIAEATDRACALSAGHSNCPYFQPDVCKTAARAAKR